MRFIKQAICAVIVFSSVLSSVYPASYAADLTIATIETTPQYADEIDMFVETGADAGVDNENKEVGDVFDAEHENEAEPDTSQIKASEDSITIPARKMDPSMYVSAYQDLEDPVEIESISVHGKGYIPSVRGADTLPSKLDFDDFGTYMPDLHNQMQFGTCWAMTSMALAEISLAKQGYEAPNLSEIHLAYFSYNKQDPTEDWYPKGGYYDPLGGTYGDVNKGIYDSTHHNYLMRGGNLGFAANTLATWTGAAPESADESLVYPADMYNPIVCYYINDELAYNSEEYPQLVSYHTANLSDRNAVKELIRKYGAVGANFYVPDGFYGIDPGYTEEEAYENFYKINFNADTNAYYDTGDTETNHAITIVGWDDDFPKENFSTEWYKELGTPRFEPAADGAWLIRNSWMDGSYEDEESRCFEGYFWMSYETGSLIRSTDPVVYAMEFKPAGNNEKCFQLDGCAPTTTIGFTDSMLIDGEISRYANNFTATDTGDVIKAVSFYTSSTNVEYVVRIYRNLGEVHYHYGSEDIWHYPDSGELVSEAVTRGQTTYAGYNYITLRNPAKINPGETFSVVLDLKKYVNSSNPAPRIGQEYSLTSDWFESTADIQSDQSWYQSQIDDGRLIWTDLYDYKNDWFYPKGNLRIKAFADSPSCTVTFDDNYEDGNQSGRVVEFGELYGDFDEPEREGYTFAGWWTLPMGGVEVTGDDIVSIAGDHTLYAHWTPISYTVTFDADGGTCDASEMTVTFGEEYNELPSPVWTGHRFLGWYTDDGDLITSETIVQIAEDHMLTARWQGAEYTVSFDFTGGTNATFSTKPVTYGVTYGVLPTAIKTGYDFVGWFTNMDVQITADTVVTATQDHTLYAHWTPKIFTVTFDAQSGTCDVESKNVTYGGTYGVLPEATRAGYRFDGWYNKKSGSNRVRIYSNTEVTTAKNHSLYANWIGETYTLTLNSNGATYCSQGEIEATYGSTYSKLPAGTNIRRTGYTFDGWYIGETLITRTSKVEITENTTAVAHWHPNIYTVTFNARGGTCGTETMNVTYDAAYGELPAPTRTGYTFDGWYLDTGCTVRVTSDTIVSTVNDHILYAKWNANTYVVTFNANGGTVTPGNKNVVYDSAYGELPVPARTGYTFDSWRLGSATSETVVTTETTVQTAGAHTLYATWTADGYTLYFHPIAGNVDPDRKDIYYGQAYGELPIPTRTGYDFDGWYTERTGGYEITAQTRTTETGDADAYAHWSPKRYKLKYYSDDGSTESSRYKYIWYGQAYGDLDTPIKPGYRFNGWYTEDGNRITEDTIHYATEDVDAFPHWYPMSFTVTLDPNGGSISNPVVSVRYEREYGYLGTPVYPGYEFIGWFTKKTGGDLITSTSIVTALGDHRLYAHWAEKNYTVTLDANGGECETETIVIGYRSAYGELPVAAKTGHDFMGWYNGTTKVEADTIYTEVYNTTLKAKWKAKTYRLNFVTTYDSEQAVSRNITYGQPYGELPELKDNYYRLVGWYDGTSEDANEVLGTDIVGVTADTTLYAHWVYDPIKVTLELYPMAGKFRQEDLSSPGMTSVLIRISYGSKIENLPTPILEGHVFAYWGDENFNRVEEGTIMTKTKDFTLYAVYVKEGEPIPDPEDPEEPTDPVTPDPTEPEVPTTPDEPTPVTPDEPVGPEEPVAPTEPEEPEEPEEPVQPVVVDEPAIVVASKTITSKTGKTLTVEVETEYDDDLEYKGVKIKKADLDITAGLTLTDEERSYADCIKISKYEIKNATNAYVYGDLVYAGMKRPYFYAVLKVDSGKAKEQGIKGKNLEALKKLVKKLNKELKANKNYFDIYPVAISDKVVSGNIKETSKKTTYTYTTDNLTFSVAVNKKCEMTPGKVYFIKSDGKKLELKKNKTYTVSCNADTRTVTITGMKNMKGTMTVTIP